MRVTVIQTSRGCHTRPSGGSQKTLSSGRTKVIGITTKETRGESFEDEWGILSQTHDGRGVVEDGIVSVHKTLKSQGGVPRVLWTCTR